MIRPGRAEAALHGAGVDERLLHVARRARLGEPLDGDDRLRRPPSRQHQARAHQPAVDEHRARPALALLAGALGGHQPEPLAQHVQQVLPHPRVGDLVVDAVDVERVVLAHCAAPGNARCSSRVAITRDRVAPVVGGRAVVVDRAAGVGRQLAELVGRARRRRRSASQSTASVAHGLGLGAADDRRRDGSERDPHRPGRTRRWPGRRWRWRSPSRCGHRPCCSPANRRAAASVIDSIISPGCERGALDARP